MTQEWIGQLYKKINNISAEYLILQKRNNVEQIKELLPQIQEFVLWFMEKNQFGIEQYLFDNMCKELVDILQDILTALEQDDKVLMHDAVTYGLCNYLKCFIEDVAEDK